MTDRIRVTLPDSGAEVWPGDLVALRLEGRDGTPSVGLPQVVGSCLGRAPGETFEIDLADVVALWSPADNLWLGLAPGTSDDPGPQIRAEDKSRLIGLLGDVVAGRVSETDFFRYSQQLPWSERAAPGNWLDGPDPVATDWIDDPGAEETDWTDDFGAFAPFTDDAGAEE